VAREVAAGRAAYHELGRSLGLPTLPSATNFVCFDLGTRRRAEAVMAALIECGVFVRKPPAPPLDRCIRLSVGTDAERRIVAAELRRVLDAVPA
jgi:histidinol-phosphate aminotransferase